MVFYGFPFDLTVSLQACFHQMWHNGNVILKFGLRFLQVVPFLQLDSDDTRDSFPTSTTSQFTATLLLTLTLCLFSPLPPLLQQPLLLSLYSPRLLSLLPLRAPSA